MQDDDDTAEVIYLRPRSTSSFRRVLDSSAGQLAVVAGLAIGVYFVKRLSEREQREAAFFRAFQWASMYRPQVFPASTPASSQRPTGAGDTEAYVDLDAQLAARLFRR